MLKMDRSPPQTVEESDLKILEDCDDMKKLEKETETNLVRFAHPSSVYRFG